MYYAYRYEANLSGTQKRPYQSFDTLDEVRNWQLGATGTLAFPETPVSTSLLEESDNSSPLFGDIVQEWKKRRFPHIAPGTRLLYEKILRLHMGSLLNLRISEITPKRLDLWVDELKAQSLLSKNRATRTNFRHELELLSTILRYYQNYHDDSTFQMPLKKRHTEASPLRRTESRSSEGSYRSGVSEVQRRTFETEKR